MKLFRSKIDRLEDNQRRLEASIEEKKSIVALKNAKLEARIIRLQEIAFKNRNELEKFTESTNLKLDKNAKLIRAEAEYARQLGLKYGKVGK